MSSSPGPSRRRRAAPDAGAFRLHLLDGSTLRGRPRGIAGGRLRFEVRDGPGGTVDLALDAVEPLSLHDVLDRSTDPADGAGLLRLAGVSARRGLYALALRDLDRAAAADPALGPRVRRRRARIRARAADRLLDDARRSAAAGRPVHARAALEDVVRMAPGGAAARAALGLLAMLGG